VLARLSALLGPSRLGSPRALDTHRPERFALAPYDPPPPPDFRPGAEDMPERVACALRALRPHAVLEVETSASGAPRALRGAGIRGRALQASGPWLLEEGWWTDDPAAREYWDVELEDHAVYRLFRDRKTGRWLADGIYD
jgi:hypothetical protein